MNNKAELPKVKKLADELAQGGREAANNAALLIAQLKPGRHETALKLAINSLKLFFVDSSHGGDLGEKRQKMETASSAPASEQDPEQLYRQWLEKQYALYITALLNLLTGAKVATQVQVVALVALMEAVRSEQGVGVFSSELYISMLKALLTSASVKPEVITLLFTKYFHYADVRFYTLSAVKVIASEYANVISGTLQSGTPSDSKQLTVENRTQKEEEGVGAEGQVAVDELACNLFDVLSHVPDSVDAAGTSGGSSLQASWCGAAEAGIAAPSQDKNERSKDRRKRKAAEAEAAASAPSNVSAEQRVQWANVKTQKRMFSEAWLSFLQLPQPQDVLRKVLIRLPASVIPNMFNPLMLADFLTYTLNQGGMLGMLALNGIFVLVTQHGLEYPRFYDRLYQLLSSEAFAARYRAQFFKLADIFLSSPLVPAYTVAAFVKKFARLGLLAPPAGAMLSIAFMHNLIRRHPACIALLHKPPKEGKEQSGEDVFVENEALPANSRAVESSIWEVDAFKHHYCPQVSALTSVLDRDLTDRMKTTEIDIDPLLSSTYGTLFTQEADRRIKQVAVAFYQQAPSKLFDINCHEDFYGWDL